MQCRTLLAVVAGLVIGCALVPGEVATPPGDEPGPPAIARPVARAQTIPVPSGGDAADDPAIWVHPQDPALSLVIGTDKRGGLAVYELSGQQLQYVPGGKINNVDLRDRFPLEGRAVTVVTATNRSDNSLAVYRVDPATRRLEPIAARPIETGRGIYGLCMYRSRATDRYYVLESGRVTSEQLDQALKSRQVFEEQEPAESRS